MEFIVSGPRERGPRMLARISRRGAWRGVRKRERREETTTGADRDGRGGAGSRPEGAGPEDARRARWLARGFVALVALVFALIVLGALVRAHEAGLACPDWPLCFGQVVPEMDLRIAFEWSHRALAGIVTLCFLALSAATLRRPRLRAAAGVWLAVAATLLGVQILLGALTVWLLLAAETVTAHLVTGNAFNACLLVLALRLDGVARPRPLPAVPRAARVALSAAGLLLVGQVVLGGFVSSTYAGLACPEWPACSGGHWFPTFRGTVGLHLAHRWNAVLLLVAVGVAAVACRGVPGLRAVATLAALLALAQTLVGIANVVLGLPVEVTGLHSALAAALILVLAAGLWEAFRGEGSQLAAAPARSAC